MSRMVFINPPVSDLDRSIAFYKAVGADRNARFTDDTASMLTFSGTIHAMLLTYARFRQFTPRRSPMRARPARC